MFLRKEAEELIRDGCSNWLLLRRALQASIEREKALEESALKMRDRCSALVQKLSEEMKQLPEYEE